MGGFSSMRIVIVLLTLVTIGMIFGALLQLAFIRNLEDSSSFTYGSAFPSFRRTLVGQNNEFPVVSSWGNDKDAAILRIGYVKPEIISWSPRIIVFHNFLSSEECDYLRALAKPRLQVSTVVDAKTGKAIEKRISTYSQIPVENGELIQVLRYEPNQFYRPHHDYFSDTAGSGECSCGGKMVKGLCVRPNKGDAVLFWSMGLMENQTLTVYMEVARSSPEKSGLLQKWMRQRATS